MRGRKESSGTSRGRTRTRTARRKTTTAAMIPAFRMVLSYPSLPFKTSWTTLGFAFPLVSFMTCPTKNERRPVLPAR